VATVAIPGAWVSVPKNSMTRESACTIGLCRFLHHWIA
jgi:hypothetical protein